MSVVKDYYIGSTHITIHDDAYAGDAYAGMGEEEMQRRKDALNRACCEVLEALRTQGTEPAREVPRAPGTGDAISL